MVGYLHGYTSLRITLCCSGDLLYKISGVSGKMTTETASEDDNFGTEQGQKIITRMLGVDRRNRVLAGPSFFQCCGSSLGFHCGSASGS
jgi:hypothetical protein